MTNYDMDRVLDLISAEVIPRLEASASQLAPVAAWISGSIVEGLAHASSDVDVYVLLPLIPAEMGGTQRHTDHVVDITFVGGTRVDVEYWAASTLDVLRSRLSATPVDDPSKSLGGYFAPIEVEFLHRLRIGQPIWNRERFDGLRSSFDWSLLSKYMTLIAIRAVDDAHDDTVGMVDSGQVGTACLRARSAYAYAIDALFHSSGDTNDKAKYRLPRLEQLAVTHPSLEPFLASFRYFEGTFPVEEAGGLQYVQDALEWAELLVDHVQSILREG